VGGARDLWEDLDHPEEELGDACHGCVLLNATSVSWAIALFFGCTIVFEAVHKLTQDSSTVVKVLAQFLTLAVIVAALVIYVRRSDDRES